MVLMAASVLLPTQGVAVAAEVPAPPAVVGLPAAPESPGLAPGVVVEALGLEGRSGLVAADELSAQQAAVREGRPVEVLAARKVTSSTFAEPDGSLTARLAAGPVWVRRGGDGKSLADWAPVDLTLIADANGRVGSVAHPNGLVLSGARPARVDGELATAGEGGASLSVRFDGALPVPVLQGPRAIYAQVRPGVDLVVEATRSGFEQFFVLTHRPRPGKEPQLRVAVTALGATARAAAGGLVEFVAGDGVTVLGSVPQASAWDAQVDGERAHPITTPWTALEGEGAGMAPSPVVLADRPGRAGAPAGPAGPLPDPPGTDREPADDVPGSPAELPGAATDPARSAAGASALHRVPAGPQVTAGRVGLDLLPDRAFLQDPRVRFPVVVDPEVRFGSGFDTWLDTGYSNTDLSGSSELRLGAYSSTGRSRSILHFDVGSLRGRQINSSTLNLWSFHSWSCSPRSWGVWATDLASTANRWDSQPYWYAKWSGSSDTFGYSSACADRWVSPDTRALVQDHADNARGVVAFGIRADDEADVLGWKKFNSANAASNVPDLYVNYDGNCTVYIAPATGRHLVCGAIFNRYAALGQTGGVLGFPTTDELTTPDGVGRYNHFSNNGAVGSIYWTPNTGAWEVYGAIRGRWAALGYERFLGYPTTGEMSTPDGIGRYNHFAKADGPASVYSTPGTGAVEVYGSIRALWASLGYERSCLGYPTRPEYPVSGGVQTDFQYGTITAGAAGATYRCPPTAPRSTTLTTGVTTSVSGSWLIPERAGGSPIEGYTWFLIASDGTYQVGTTTASVRSMSGSGLTAGLAYRLDVYARNATGSGPPGQAGPVNVGTVASPPTALQLTPGAGRIDAGWGPPVNSGGYPVQGYDWTLTGPTGTLVRSGTTSPTSRTAVMTGLTNGTAYTFTVNARTLKGAGSTAGGTRTPVTTASAVTGLLVNGLDGAFEASWGVPLSDGGAAITGYGWTVTGPGENRTGTTTATARTVTQTGLVNGTGYTFTVQAQTAAGPGTPASSPVTPATVPTVPAALTVELAQAGAGAQREDVLVSFDRSAANGAPITGYELRRTVDGVLGPVEPCPGCETGTGGVRFTLPDTTVGSSISVQVRAVNGRGSSAFSAGSAVVVPAGRPAAPTAVTGTEQSAPGGTEIRVGWTAGPDGSAPLTGHTIRTYDSAGNQIGELTPAGCAATCTSAIITGLTAGGSYTFTVTATNRVGTGPASALSGPVVVHTPPTMTRTVTAAPDSLLPGVHRRGETVQYTLTLTNPNDVPLNVAAISNTLPAGSLVPSVRLGEQLCAGCLLTDNVLRLVLPDGTGGDAGTLAAGASATFTYLSTLAGSERDCLSEIIDTVSVSSAFGDLTDTATTTVCAGGLGLEPWWSYWSTEIGPQATAAVNAANGNLVLTATDSTPVQGHGRLGYVLRRSYNSQELTAATLPGSLGAGWALNLGHTDDLAGTGVSGTALIVPRLGELVTKITDPLSVTLLDRDGTRHLFSPKLGLPALNLPALTGELATLAPKAVQAPAGRTLCLDVAYQAPAGVHLGMFRYLSVVGDCASITAASDPAVLGYVTVRPDRVRHEYAATGQLLSMTDGAGNELRYGYEGHGGAPVLGGIVLPTQRLSVVYEPNSCTAGTDSSNNPSLPAQCRAFRLSYPTGAVAVSDPAGRTTTYRLEQVPVAGLPGPVQVLAQVVNPDVAAPTGTLTYRYQGDPASSAVFTDCGGSPLQLCSATDPAGNTTRFGYTTGDGVLGGAGRVSAVTERPRDPAGGGTLTTFAYPDRQSTIAVRGGSQQRSWTGIDDYGRTARTVDGPVGDITAAGYPAAHDLQTSWDIPAVGTEPAVGCTTASDGSTVGRDNNLCAQTQRGGSNPTGAPTPDRQTTFSYDDAGMLLTQQQSNQVAAVTGTDARGRPSFTVRDGAPAQLVTTHGYLHQQVRTDGRRDLRWEPAGSGQLTRVQQPGSATGPELFRIVDRTSTLGSRGNAAGAGWAAYVSSWQLDNTTGQANRRPAENVCAPGAAGGNSGLVCAETQPYRSPDGVDGAATTTFSYDSFGQKKTRTTAQATADGVAAGQAAGSYRYVYYGDAERELTGSVSAGGWLKAVVDPDGNYVAFAHDRAGNTARTWDRNATAGRGPPDTFDVTSDRRTDTRFGTGPDALARPWRNVLSVTDPLGNTTSSSVDPNGHPISARPPRGNAAGNDSFDTLRTVNAWGQSLTVSTPEHRDTPSRFGYDPFGNTVSTVDGRGTLSTTGFDVVNRPVLRTFVRGGFDPATAPAACQPSPAGSPFGDGMLLCTTGSVYDRHDNPVRTSDPDGRDWHAGFDSLGRKTVTVSPRDDLDPDPQTADFSPHVISETVYEATVPVRVCNPRQYDPSEPGATSSCPAGAVHATSTSFDVADRPDAASTFRAAGQPLTRTFGFDRNGNPTRSTDPRGTTSTAAYDSLDRRVSMSVPREAGVSLTTRWQHDPVGNTIAVLEPGAAGDNAGAGGAGTDLRITGFTYDADNRVLDTVTALQVPAADPAADSSLATVELVLATARPDESAQTNLRSRVGYDPDGNIDVRYDQRAFVTGSLSAPDQRFALRTAFDRNSRPVGEHAPRYDSGAGALAADPTGSSQQAAECPTGTAGYPAGVGVCTTTLSYDANGNITSVGLPDDPADPSPRRLAYSYTADNLIASVQAPDPSADGSTVAVTSTVHDGSGRPVRSTNAAGHTTSTEFYADGLTRAVIPPAGPGGLAPRTEWVYNSAGMGVQTRTFRRTYSPDSSQPTGEQKLVTAKAWTADGLLAATTTGGTDPAQPDGGGSIVTSYGYDPNGNPTEVVSPNANASRRGQLVSANPAGVATVHRYTLDDLLAGTEQPVLVGLAGAESTRSTTYSYDRAGRKTSVQVGTTGQPGDPQSFGYYPTGALESTTGRAGAGGGTISRGYDAGGQPTRVDQTVGGVSTQLRSRFYLDGSLLDTVSTDGVAATSRTAFGYDGVGARTARADGPADGVLTTATFTTSDAGVPVSMSDPAAGSGQTSWAYNTLGQPVREMLPSGQTQTFDYHTDDTLASTQVSSSSALAEQAQAGTATADLASYTYSYDELGRVLSQAHHGSGAGGEQIGSPAAPVSFRYSYDTAGRLETFRDARGLRALSYDPNGNRLDYGTAGQPDPSSFAYRADDSIATATRGTGLAATTRTYSYDPYGGLTGDGCASNSYDGFDRLSSSTAIPGAPPGSDCPAGSSSFGYDGLDRQISITRSSGTVPVTTSSTSSYRYDGLSTTAWQRTDSSPGNPDSTVEHTLGPDGRTIASTQTGQSPRYLATDGAGSTALITTADKAVECATRYDPYGNPASNTTTGGPPATPCASGAPGIIDSFYRGQRRDSGTGTYQLGARTYDPTKAGFLTPDSYRDSSPAANLSLGVDPLTRNSYSYVNGDPVNYTDPDGHRRCDAQERRQGCYEASEDTRQGRSAASLRAAREMGSQKRLARVRQTEQQFAQRRQQECASSFVCRNGTQVAAGTAGVVVGGGCLIGSFGVGSVGCVGAGFATYSGVSSYLGCRSDGSAAAGCVARAAVVTAVTGVGGVAGRAALGGRSALVAASASGAGASGAGDIADQYLRTGDVNLTQAAISTTLGAVTGGAAHRLTTVAGAAGAAKPVQGQTVYRVYGGDSKATGPSWSPVDPRSVPNFRDVAGLPSGGASGATNSGRFVIEGELLDPAKIVLQRQALTLDGMKGRLPEYIIPGWLDNGAIRINRVSGVNPEF